MAALANSPPSQCLQANESAANCLRHGGFFFDACTGHCEREMSFLRLNQYLQLEHFVYGYLFPVLVLLVVVANVLVALVLSQRHMLSPTNVVLKYMAIADLCVGLFPLPWNFYYHTLRHFEHEQQELQLWWCYAYKYSMDAIPPVCHNIAMWLTVLLAGQRYLSIRHPVNSRQLCSVRNVRIATVLITFLSLICGLPKCVDYHYRVYEGWAFVEPENLIHLRSCLSGFTIFVKLVGSNAFFNAYFWTRVVGFILVPSLLLICLNALLIRSIRKAQQRKLRLLKEKRNREAQRQTDSNSTSVMLVIIVSIFLLVNLPQALFMAMLCVYNTLNIPTRFLEGMFPVTFLLVSNMLVMATYPINFGIYCFMSSSFRDTFRMLFFNTKGRLGRPLGSRRVPSLVGGARSEVTRLSLSLIRRSTDPQPEGGGCQKQQGKGQPAGSRELRPSCSPSNSSTLLSEPPPDPPQPKATANGKLAQEEQAEAPSPLIDGTGEGGAGGGEMPPMPTSPTGTVLGETIFL